MNRWPARSPELELAGTDEFGAILSRTRRQLRDSIATAARAGKEPRETTREVRINARWGWTYWQVDAHDSTELVEIGFTRPGTSRGHLTLIVANSDNGGWMRTVGGLAGAGLGGIGGMAGFAVTTPALAIAGAGAALGVGVASWVRHRLNRWADDSVRIRGVVLDQLPQTRAARAMNAIDFKISDFHTRMSTAAAQHGTAPVPMPLDQTPDELLGEIHHAVWDLASGQTSNTEDEILNELAHLTNGIDDAIDAAWSTWNAARLPIPPAPDHDQEQAQPDPALLRPTVDRLSRITGSVRDAHTASTKAAQDLRAINQPDQDQDQNRSTVQEQQ